MYNRNKINSYEEWKLARIRKSLEEGSIFSNTNRNKKSNINKVRSNGK